MKTKFIPYTHKELGIPEYLEIGGFRVQIVFDSKIMSVTDNNGNKLNPVLRDGFVGVADFSLQQIKLWTGNKIEKPTKQRILQAFLEEINHWIFFCMQIKPGDHLDSKLWLHKNEHLVAGYSILLLQVLRQLKDVKWE